MGSCTLRAGYVIYICRDGEVARELESPAHHFDQASRDGQPEPTAPVHSGRRLISLLEFPKILDPVFPSECRYRCP